MSAMSIEAYLKMLKRSTPPSPPIPSLKKSTPPPSQPIPSESLKKSTPPPIPSEMSCSICVIGSRNIAYVPCGHVLSCAECADRFSKCPYCRTPLTDKLKLYFV